MGRFGLFILFVIISILCLVLAIVVKVYNEQWKRNGNDNVRRIVTYVLMLLLAVDVIVQVNIWMK